MQPVGFLNMECGLLYLNFLFAKFCNGFLVGASQKNPFLKIRKRKIDFLCKEKINPQHQHCSTSQDTQMCTRWGHLNKLCHGSGHNLAHLA